MQEFLKNYGYPSKAYEIIKNNYILKDKKTWHLDSGLYIIEEADLEDKWI